MHKIIISTILSLFLTSLALGQEQVTVSGKILEKDTNIPLEWATVVISNPTDGKIVSGGSANEKGDFNFKVVAGTYNVSFEFMSFKTQTLKAREINKSTDFGNIYLIESATDRKSVV